jgi:hypothetical protein
MKTILTACVLALVVALAGPSASASIFVTNLVDGSNSLPIPGNQAYGGQLGDDFTTGNYSITITRIGVFDDDGDGTASDKIWQLFNVATGGRVAQQTVSATGARTPGSTITDNYVWADLSTPIVLAANTTYSAVAYGFTDTDKNFNTNTNLSTLDVEFSNAGLTAQGGRYSAVTFIASIMPGIGAANVASTQAYNFGAATFEYAVPEAASIAVWSVLGLAGMAFGVVRRRRNRA